MTRPVLWLNSLSCALSLVLVTGCRDGMTETELSDAPADSQTEQTQVVDPATDPFTECAADPCDLPFEPIDANDIWTLTSSTPRDGEVYVNVSGSGSVVQVVGVTLNPLQPGGCTAFLPDVSFQLRDRSISLQGDIHNEATQPGEIEDVSCSIEVVGDISCCGNKLSFGFGPGLDIFDVTFDAQVTIGGQAYAVGDLDLSIVRGPDAMICDAPPASLADAAWSVSLSDPMVPGPFAPGQASVNVSGNGEMIEFANLHDEQGPGCFADMPAGEVRFDGERLELDLLLEDESGANGCELVFEGSVEHCDQFDLHNAFVGLGITQVLLIRGSGVHVGGAQEVEFDTMYLSVTAQEAP